MEKTTKTELKNTLETAAENRDIVVYGLTQNNLKHVLSEYPKRKLRCSPVCPVLGNQALSLIRLPLNRSAR